MNLYIDTLKMLKQLPRTTTYADIERDTGISKEWISAVAREKISEPGVIKIQKLHDYLKTVL